VKLDQIDPNAYISGEYTVTGKNLDALKTIDDFMNQMKHDSDPKVRHIRNESRLISDASF